MPASIDRYSDWTVEFPDSPDFDMLLLYAELSQKQEAHDILVLQFKGAVENHTRFPIKQGDPIKFTWGTKKHKSVFVGFIHLIEKDTTHANTFTRVICVNNSEILKKTGKEIFKNKTPDAIIAQVCSENKLSSVTSIFPHSYSSVAQAGQSYWQLFKRLANATGYALRAENTEVLFEDQDKLIFNKLATAPTFVHFSRGPVGMAAQQTLINFTALGAKDSLELNQGDMGIMVSGRDGTKHSFNKGHGLNNGKKPTGSTEVPSDWQKTYGVVPETTIDGLHG